jgi:transcription elongation factor Elf1
MKKSLVSKIKRLFKCLFGFHKLVWIADVELPNKRLKVFMCKYCYDLYFKLDESSSLDSL